MSFEAEGIEHRVKVVAASKLADRGADVTAMALREGTLLGEVGKIAVGLFSEAKDGVDDIEVEGASACSPSAEAEPLST
jgi:hypothetical protein